MSNDITGTKMTIDFRNIQSNQTDATNKQSASATVPENTSQSPDSSPAPATQDTVELSNQAQVIQSVVAQIAQPPQSNPERIESLRAAINTGEFTVSAESIASKLLSIDFGNRNQD